MLYLKLKKCDSGGSFFKKTDIKKEARGKIGRVGTEEQWA